MQIFSQYVDDLIANNPGTWSITHCDGDASYFRALENNTRKQKAKKTFGISSLWRKNNEAHTLWTRDDWENKIRGWLDKGHKMTVILSTQRNLHGIEAWQRIANNYPSNMKVYVLVRDKAALSEMKKDIERLDAFHPTLLEGPNNTTSMWIEHYHPSGSKDAHHVEEVGPLDCNTNDRNRFMRFKTILENLIGSDNEQLPPHVIEITCDFVPPSNFPKKEAVLGV